MSVTLQNVGARSTRSDCCSGRVDIRLVNINTQNGKQLVWSCVKCGRLYVLREKDADALPLERVTGPDPRD